MRKGFTLIEMMVVITIIGLALSMTLPLFKASPSLKVRAAATQLVRDLELARTRALSTKSAAEMLFNVTGNSYAGYLDDNRDGKILETTTEMQALRGGFPVQLSGDVKFGRGSAATPVPGDTSVSTAVTFSNNRLTFGTNGVTTPFGTAGAVYLVSTTSSGTVAAVSVTGAGSFKVWIYKGGGLWQ